MAASTITQGERSAHRWRRFYTILGSGALVIGFLGLASPLQGAISGCSIHFTQDSFDSVGSSNPTEESCAYFVDLTLAAIPLLAGSVLLLAVWRYRRTDFPSSILTATAIPVGVALGAMPLYTVWWLVDYYRLGVGPMEVIMFGVALTVLGLAVVAGWRTAQYLLTRGTSDPRAASSG